MFPGEITLPMILAVLPEILLVVLALIVLAFDLALPAYRRSILGWITAFGLFAIIAITLVIGRPGPQAEMVWGGMLRHDWLGFVFKMVFLFSAAITALFALEQDRLGNRGEFYLLMLASTLGMTLMASAADLIMLYLAFETTSIPMYVLAGFMTRDDKSIESGFKYLLFGAMTSAIMLYGFSLLYGFTGTTNIYLLAQKVQAGQLSMIPLFGSMLLVLVGFGFKIAAVPLHFWAPDVYEGAPTPITGFLSTASKAAGFAIVMRFLLVAFPYAVPYWGAILAALATATMTLGNTLALAQHNIKRMLAYSSIAHAGYAMIGVVSVLNPGGTGTVSNLGVTSTVLYVMVYIVTNLAAFGVVTVVSRVTCSDEISSYAGLSRRSPGLALAMLVSFLSLAGMPPFGGFIAKFTVFAAAIQSNLVWLAVIGVLNSIIGLYYYMSVLKVVYLYRSEDENKPLPVPRPYVMGLIVLTVGIILIGTAFAPWFSLSNVAAAGFY